MWLGISKAPKGSNGQLERNLQNPYHTYKSQTPSTTPKTL